MNKLGLVILTLALSVAALGCSGPAGPPGPQGPAGIPGANGPTVSPEELKTAVAEVLGPAPSPGDLRTAIFEALDELGASSSANIASPDAEPEAPTLSEQSASEPIDNDRGIKIGILGAEHSFSTKILPSRQYEFDDITDRVAGIRLSDYDLIILNGIDLTGLNGPSFRQFVHSGGVLLVHYWNTGWTFSSTWSPYALYANRAKIREATIIRPKHPIFEGFNVTKFGKFMYDKESNFFSPSGRSICWMTIGSFLPGGPAKLSSWKPSTEKEVSS